MYKEIRLIKRRINEAEYKSAYKAECTIEANTFVNILIHLYHDEETDIEKNHDSAEDSSGIQT